MLEDELSAKQLVKPNKEARPTTAPATYLKTCLAVVSAICLASASINDLKTDTKKVSFITNSHNLRRSFHAIDVKLKCQMVDSTYCTSLFDDCLML